MAEFKNNLDWKLVCEWQKLSEKFISDFRNNVDWKLVCKYQKLSEKFISDFRNNVDWKLVCEYQKLSDDFIIEFDNYLCWEKITRNQILSEKLIVDFHYKLYWPDVCKFQKLSENLIVDFHYKLYWPHVWEFQKLSRDFIDKNRHIFSDKFDEILRSYYVKCPISKKTMKDPVVAEDGYSYDRSNIEKWFKKNSTTPNTDSPINKTLIPNIALRNLIEHFNEKSIFCDESPSDYIICPISIVIMKDPVITEDGHTYDRSNIEKWFENSDISPVTNLIINKTLISNITLKNLILCWKKD
jgi:hypothetical protein